MSLTNTKRTTITVGQMRIQINGSPASLKYTVLKKLTSHFSATSTKSMSVILVYNVTT